MGVLKFRLVALPADLSGEWREMGNGELLGIEEDDGVQFSGRGVGNPRESKKMMGGDLQG